jgi:hypothetical protein
MSDGANPVRRAHTQERCGEASPVSRSFGRGDGSRADDGEATANDGGASETEDVIGGHSFGGGHGGDRGEDDGTDESIMEWGREDEVVEAVAEVTGPLDDAVVILQSPESQSEHTHTHTHAHTHTHTHTHTRTR